MNAPTREEQLKCLESCALLAELGADARSRVLEHLHLIEGARGDRLYNEGDAGSGMYIVVRGACAAVVRDVSDNERVVQRLGVGDSFGELSVLLRGERLVSIVATEDVFLLELSVQDFRQLKRSDPDICVVLIMAIVRRFGRVLDESREVMKRMLLRYMGGVDTL